MSIRFDPTRERGGSSTPDRSTRTAGWVLVGTQGALLLLLALASNAPSWSVPAPVQMAGTVLRWVGGAAILIGALRLGAGVSVHPAPTASAELRTNGPYRFVRHPIYTGVLLVAGGIAVTAGSPGALVVFAALAAVLSVKARFEERLLARRFPDYDTYARSTPRFLPLPARRRRPGR